MNTMEEWSCTARTLVDITGDEGIRICIALEKTRTNLDYVSVSIKVKGDMIELMFGEKADVEEGMRRLAEALLRLAEASCMPTSLEASSGSVTITATSSSEAA